MNIPAHNPHLIWISPLFWMAVGFGTYLAHKAGYEGVVIPIRRGQLRTVGKIYKARNEPYKFLSALAWNALIATGSCTAVAMMVWFAWSAEIWFFVLSIGLLGFIICSSEFLYRLAFRSMLRGVFADRACSYRRDRQPKKFGRGIFSCLFLFLINLFLLSLLITVWWALGNRQRSRS